MRLPSGHATSQTSCCCAYLLSSHLIPKGLKRRNLYPQHRSFCKMEKISLLLCAINLIFSLQNPKICLKQLKLEDTTPEQKKLLFVFGDSLFDVGNNQYLNVSGGTKLASTSWPYGITFHNHSTGRLSDGLLLPDFIAQYAKLRLIPPYMQPGANFMDGVNFASAGSGVLDQHYGVINLRTQLDNFKKVVSIMEQTMGKSEARKTLMRSVFMFSCGGNDYLGFYTKYPNATEHQRKLFVQAVLGNLTNALKELYEMGARKIAIQNVGPMGCYPVARAMFPNHNSLCIHGLQTLALLHNRALPLVLKKLDMELSGFKHAIFDYYNALQDRILNPIKYGFKVGIVACCGNGAYNCRGCGGGANGTEPYNLCSNPSEYVLFDGGHHTEKTNVQLSKLFWSGVGSTTVPHSLKQLFESP